MGECELASKEVYDVVQCRTAEKGFDVPSRDDEFAG